jgi:hypothetical protein
MGEGRGTWKVYMDVCGGCECCPQHVHSAPAPSSSHSHMRPAEGPVAHTRKAWCVRGWRGTVPR